MKRLEWKDFITTHPWMKVVSLLMAFVLWAFVHAEQHIEKTINVKVQLKNVPTHLIVSREVETSLNLRLKGPRTRVSRIDENYFKDYSIDLADARKGLNTFQVFEEDFSLPRGTRIIRLAPQMIRIFLDDAEERLVRVEPALVGQLDDGFELGGEEINPPYVKLRGARSDLDGMNSVKTEPISLSGRRATFEGVYAVRVPSSMTDSEEKKVTVKINIREREVSKILQDIPVVVAGTSRSVKVEPQKVTLNIRGPAGEVATFIGEKQEIQINAKELGLDRRRAGAFRVRPALPKRTGIEITMVPDNVLLTLTREN